MVLLVVSLGMSAPCTLRAHAPPLETPSSWQVSVLNVDGEVRESESEKLNEMTNLQPLTSACSNS